MPAEARRVRRCAKLTPWPDQLHSNLACRWTDRPGYTTVCSPQKRRALFPHHTPPRTYYNDPTRCMLHSYVYISLTGRSSFSSRLLASLSACSWAYRSSLEEDGMTPGGRGVGRFSSIFCDTPPKCVFVVTPLVKQGGGAEKWPLIWSTKLASHIEHEQCKITTKWSLCILSILIRSPRRILLAFCLLKVHALSFEGHVRINMKNHTHFTV